MLKNLFLPCLMGFISFCLWASADAATIDTLSLSSRSLQKETKVVVILPDTYSVAGSLKFPVVYLLHGYSGNYLDWVKKVPAIGQYSDKYRLIIVCPDGENSWYIDSKSVSHSNYESYVGVELPAYIDNHYRTFKDRSSTAITGLSMGGHGAMYLALRHPQTFGAVGSMSGVLDVADIRSHLNVGKIMGDTTLAATQKYSDLSLISVADSTLAIIFDCGVDDGLIDENRAMHKRMMELKILHDYTERPGGHTWSYWANSVEYHLLFFRKFFDKKS